MITVELSLKLNKSERLSGYEQELVAVADNGNYNRVRISTNSLWVENDRKDARYVNALKGVKVVYDIGDDGILLLMGNLNCSFRDPFGGEFYVTKAIKEKANYDDVSGVDARICFETYPMCIDDMQRCLAKLKDNDDFVYNLSQFDEFMRIFNFYKGLSAELNNNVTYAIRKKHAPYYFVPINEKNIETEEKDVVKNDLGVVMGHRLDRHLYERLSFEAQGVVRTYVDIEIDDSAGVVSTIKRMAKSLYMSDESEVNERNVRGLIPFELANISKKGKSILLSGEYEGAAGKYLHLYDMGQKIKIESIDNSLRLINQGGTGAASQLLQYLIGDEPMPSEENNGGMEAAKEIYAKHLDESQKQAFLMATDGSPISLIKGPPGTGKTYVINAIVQYIIRGLKGKVIIASQTHVAIDNVLDKLLENHDIIVPNRITNRRNKYAGTEIDKTLYATWGTKFTRHNALSENVVLRGAVEKDMAKFDGKHTFCFSTQNDSSDYSVIGATTTTSTIGGKKGLELFEGYDWLIIDEVSKCPITEVLRYLPYVKNIIMVGDDYQLGPLLEFEEREVEHLKSFNKDDFEKLKAVYEQSVFAKTLTKAREAGRLVELDVNYRSVSGVLRAYNVFYENRLKNKRESIRPQKVQFDEKVRLFNDKDVFFVEVKNGKEARDNHSRYNVEELRATAAILRDLIDHMIGAKNVTVSAIFPYAAQINRFQKDYKDLINEAKIVFKSFDIDTVDAFQGKESDVVLVNTVVTTTGYNFLKEFRRINVAMSRSRDKLFVFGNSHILSKIEMEVTGGNKRRYFDDIVADIKRYGGFITYSGKVNYENTGRTTIRLAENKVCG